MHLAVFGANGPTGRLVVRQAIAAGHHVSAVTRRPDEYPLNSPRLSVVAADVTDAGAVERMLAGQQAVISTFGVPYSRKQITVYSHGIANIVRGMTCHGVTRLICVSSATVATNDVPDESLWWRKVVTPILRNVVGRTLYQDMRRMEEIVQHSNLNWTIVRPGGLFNAAAPTDDYETGPPRLRGRFTSRADLAEVLVKEATRERYPCSVIEIVTRSAKPHPASFLREAFGHNG